MQLTDRVAQTATFTAFGDNIIVERIEIEKMSGNVHIVGKREKPWGRVISIGPDNTHDITKGDVISYTRGFRLDNPDDENYVFSAVNADDILAKVEFADASDTGNTPADPQENAPLPIRGAEGSSDQRTG